jgi:hypothetical protein
VSDVAHEEALRQADALISQALGETEARCAVLAQYINDCETRGSKTASWSEALRELRALHDYRIGLMRRHSLIQQALDCPVGECQGRSLYRRHRTRPHPGLSIRFRFEPGAGEREAAVSGASAAVQLVSAQGRIAMSRPFSASRIIESSGSDEQVAHEMGGGRTQRGRC